MKSSYENIIHPDSQPFYILFLNIDPTKIDINVHPTKHEIKFEDERLIYQFLKAATRYSLAQFSLTPQLNFEDSNPGIERMMSGVEYSRNPNHVNQNPGSQASWLQLAKPGQPNDFESPKFVGYPIRK